VIDVLGNQPDPRRQAVLPHVVGIEAAPEDESRIAGHGTSRRSDPVLRSILGGQGEMGLALLDPLGRSHYRWTAYSQGYFARINAHVIAILERDTAKSGLYRSRKYARQPERTPEHLWIERHYLPLRQQVALVQEATAGTSLSRRAQQAGPNVRPRRPSPSTSCAGCCSKHLTSKRERTRRM
jgi:hypothetical protein